MKVLVTGVNGQLGYDVMKELYKRGYEGIGTDQSTVYSGIRDNSPVVFMPYVELDITKRDAVKNSGRTSSRYCGALCGVDSSRFGGR